MPQNDHHADPADNDTIHHQEPTPNPATESSPQPEPASQSTAPEDESTIGTGTSMALGCIAGTVVLIAFGLLLLALSTLR